MGNIIETAANAAGLKLGNFTIENLVTAIIVLLVCLVAIKIIMRIVSPFISRLPIEKTLIRFLTSVIKALLYFITVIIVASSLGIEATSLIALFSVIGLAVSLAVQGSLSNLASGIMVLLARPFSVGDFIEAGNVSGTVREIGLIYTKLSTFDNKIIFIPNSDISSSRITNYSSEPMRRVDLKFNVSYDDDIDKVKEIILKAVEKCGVFVKEPAVFVGVTAYLESSIEYTVRAWAKTEDYWDGYNNLLEGVKKEFDFYGISMTYNHLNVHIVNDKK